MKIFISWSGTQSKEIALALEKWLQDVFLDIETWVSASHIDAGQRWGNELNNQLESTNFGVLCLTPENLSSPWLLFEAGSISKVIKESKVVPYLYNLSTTDVPFPLAQFQGVEANDTGTFKLIQSINNSRKNPIPEDRTERVFDKWWPDLMAKLELVKGDLNSDSTNKRSERDLLEEILQTVRGIDKSNIHIKSETDNYLNGKPISSYSQKDYPKMTIDDLVNLRTKYRFALMKEGIAGSTEYHIEKSISFIDEEIKQRKSK